MYDITNINKSLQHNTSNMNATKQGKLHIKVRQVDGSEILQTLWFVKYCERMQGSKLYSNEKIIVLENANGNILLDHQIKMRNG